MRDVLRRWVADTETQHNIEDFELDTHLQQLAYLQGRGLDLYFSLVGELFDRVRDGSTNRSDWATLAQGLSAASRALRDSARADALFFSAVAFYCGGYPASALLTMRRVDPDKLDDRAQRAGYELLTRRGRARQNPVQDVLAMIRQGDLGGLDGAVEVAQRDALNALVIGPDEWVARQLYAMLLIQLRRTNIRAVLPNGSSDRWDPLVTSFLDRVQPVWDFFPSQIEAIDAGLLTSPASYSLQMPTGAGKTALMETLLFSHLTESPESTAVLLVPYRALARELRWTVGRRLTDMGLLSRTVYGGTVPTIEEGESLESVRAIIATPEALAGLLGSHPDLMATISLVVCDEGHLLGSETRGIGLELLLARFRARTPSPRIIFVSAIVPNVEEINAWLGGAPSTVVRSDYQPATAEFAVLRPSGTGKARTVGLELQEISSSVPTHTIPSFLEAKNFTFTNSSTGRRNVYGFGSTKSQAIATARRALALGSVAVFATEKGGNRGVLGLAQELINQTSAGIPLPSPREYAGDIQILADVAEYLINEYGQDWVGTRVLHAGAVVHHGDLPQETREVFEQLVIDRHIPLVLCTSTLAEGVNLPIRTMVLYSVRRSSDGGAPIALLARDIKNLVGRAGRAGSSTRGLVVCANPDQWQDVRPVAEGVPGEPVEGALIALLRRLERAVVASGTELNNGLLEGTVALLPLVDSIDATLIELIHDELGNDEFLRIARSLAAETFAAQKANEEQSKLLRNVFWLRAGRLLGLRSTGRLEWVRASSGRPRLVESVIENLFPRYGNWTTLESVGDLDLLRLLVSWAFEQPGFAADVEVVYHGAGIEDTQASLIEIVASWLQGRALVEIAQTAGLDIDTLLRIHAKIVLYDLVTLAEQAFALIQQHLLAQGLNLSPTAASFPDHLRYGVATSSARELLARGVRHRRAAVALGAAEAMTSTVDIFASPWSIARGLLEDRDTWMEQLGSLIYTQTVADVAIRTTSP